MQRNYDEKEKKEKRKWAKDEVCIHFKRLDETRWESKEEYFRIGCRGVEAGNYKVFENTF